MLSAGSKHSLGISEIDGSLWSWGSNYYGQLGQGEDVPSLSEPTKIPETQSFIQISAGDDFSLALDSNGHVWYFGCASHGRARAIGIEMETEKYQCVPVRMKNLSHIKSISAGFWHGIVLDLNGNVWSFGYNNYGQLGIGDTPKIQEPFLIKQLPPIVKVSSGVDHSLILDYLGNVWSFGFNECGQLGRSDDESQHIPHLIPGMKDIIQIFAAGDSSILINAEQKVFVFGSNQATCLVETQESDIYFPVERELWRGKLIIPGGGHTIQVDEEGYLSFFGVPSNVQQGQHENVQIEQRKFVSTKNARSIATLD